MITFEGFGKKMESQMEFSGFMKSQDFFSDSLNFPVIYSRFQGLVNGSFLILFGMIINQKLETC